VVDAVILLTKSALLMLKVHVLIFSAAVIALALETMFNGMWLKKHF